MRPWLAAIALLVLLTTAWIVGSPKYALNRVASPGAPSEAEIARRIDSPSIRASLASQLAPLLDPEAGPPFTRDVILDALSSPRGVRLLALDPHGDWRFAAAAGLPQHLRQSQDGMIPRSIDTPDWQIDRQGLSRFAAVSTALPESNRLHFRRDGIRWVLDRVELGGSLRDE